MPFPAPENSPTTAAAITCAVEWRRVSRSSLMAVPQKGQPIIRRVLVSALTGLKALQPGGNVFPSEAAIVEKRLDVCVHLKNHGGLMRQGNDRRSSSLTSEALLPAGVHRAAANAAVLGGCLLDGDVTARTSARLERSGWLETVSDPHYFLLSS